MERDFTLDHKGYVIAHIDGACPRNGYHGAKGGIGVWFGDQHPLNVSEPLRREEFIYTNPTNQIAEIKAAIKACQILRGVGRIRLFTDSTYLIDSITNWIYIWQSNGWRKSNGEQLVHTALFKELLYLTREFDHVEWVHVASNNNKADILAKRGAERY